jgi:hypothetical protein
VYYRKHGFHTSATSLDKRGRQELRAQETAAGGDGADWTGPDGISQQAECAEKPSFHQQRGEG